MCELFLGSLSNCLSYENCPHKSSRKWPQIVLSNRKIERKWFHSVTGTPFDAKIYTPNCHW